MTGRSLHEECGVFGAFGVDNAYDVVLEGLFALQHRGQEGCGIAFMGPEGKPVVDKGAGLVSEVFSKTRPRTRPGRSAIGHVRYGTSGGRELDNVQPFVFHSCDTFQAAFAQSLPDIEILFEQILVYFLFVYVCGAVYDDSLISKVRMAVLATESISLLSMAAFFANGQSLSHETILRITVHFCRELEHSDENLDLVESYLDAD